jgi:hypothetical protein
LTLIVTAVCTSPGRIGMVKLTAFTAAEAEESVRPHPSHPLDDSLTSSRRMSA